MTTRTPISEIRCLAVDVVLLGSFEWRELANLLQQTGLKVPQCCPAGQARLVAKAAHNATHGDSRFTRLLERQLDYRYADRIRQIAATEACELAQLFRLQGVESDQLAEIVWALARDPRAEFRPLLDDLLHQAQFLALRTLLTSQATEQAS